MISPHWSQVAEAQRDRLVSKWGATVDLICIGNDYERGERVDAMLEKWATLRAQENLTTRFNDPDRIVPWLAAAESDGGSAPLVVLGEAGDSAALLVGEIQELAVIKGLPIGRLIGVEVLETGFVARPGAELDDLCTAMLESLLSEGAADRLKLHSLPIDDPAFDTMRSWNRIGALGITESKIRWGARLLDPETGERVDMHSGKTRANLRKADRKLVKAFEGDVELECITESDQVNEFVRAATSIIQETYQAALGIGVLDTDAYRALLCEMADSGALRGYLMRCKGEAVVYVVGDRWGDTFSLWGTAFRPEHRKLAPGIVTIRRVMDSLAAEGVAHFDFGCGHAEYKKKLGDHHRDESDFLLFAKRPAATLSFVGTSASKAAKDRARKVVDELGWRDRLRKMWRDRLRKS